MDRSIKVFKLSNRDQVGQFEKNFELSEEFYDVTIDDIRREQKMREELLERAGLLKTKAMREREKKLELRKYKYALLRVKFPNEYILQAIFRANFEQLVSNLGHSKQLSSNFCNLQIVAAGSKRRAAECRAMVRSPVPGRSEWPS